MADQWSALAVEALISQIESGYAAQLRTIETSESLATGSLEDPVAYVAAFVPDDNRSPLISVWEKGFSPDTDGGQREGRYLCPVSVNYQYVGQADPEANELAVRRSVTALMRVILADETLGSTVAGCEFVDATAHVEPGERSAVKHGYQLDWDLHIGSS